MISLFEHLNNNIHNLIILEENASNKIDAIESDLYNNDISLYKYLFPDKEQDLSIYKLKYNGRKIISSNKNSLKTFLNLWGERGCTFKFKTGGDGNVVEKHWKTGKYADEYIRGAFGHESTSKDNVTEILSKIGLDDVKVDDPKIDSRHSSRSYQSMKVTWHDKEFWVCNTDMVRGKGGQTKRVLISTESIQPKGLGISANDPDNAYNISKGINNIIDDVKSGLSKSVTYDQGPELLSFFIESIANAKEENYKLDNNILANLGPVSQAINLTHTIDFENNKALANVWKELPSQEKDSIKTGFGEVLTGFMMYKNCKPSDRISLYWPDNGSEFLNDLYFNGIGVSVKADSSDKGHRPSAMEISKRIINNLDKEGVRAEIDTICNAYNITKEEMDEFIERLKLFYKTSVKRQDQNRNIWKIAWSLLENDKYFKEVCKTLKLNKDEYPNIPDALEIVDNLSTANRKKFMNNLLGILNKHTKADFTWQVVNWDNCKSIRDTDYFSGNGAQQTSLYKKNYSKIMYVLIARCINELNNLYCNTKTNKTDEKDTTNLFSILLNNYLKTNQSYTIINYNEKDNNITINIKLYAMNKSLFMFDLAGCGPSDWNGHGTIGFKVINNKK